MTVSARYSLPDPDTLYPIVLPDGTPHHGTVLLRAAIDHPQISVGAYTYASDFDPPDREGWAARLAPYLFDFSQDHLRIGKFCQIAHGVRFLGASANHATGGITTFPFQVFARSEIQASQPDTRDMEIGNDVWLGHGARVLAGARIGNGVIVGAGAVVRGKVPDYAVVTGNPGRVQRMRFAPTEIAKLNRLAWWDWPASHIAQARPYLEGGDISMLERIAP